MKIAELAIEYRKALILIILILALAGVYSAFQLPSGVYPEVNFPRIVVLAETGDLPAGSMLLGVTRPIEEALSGSIGLYRVRSSTIRGESELSLLFLPNTNMDLALQQVQAKVTQVRSALPEQTEVTVERLTPAVFPVMIYNLTGRETSAADLRDYARYTVQPTLSRIPGVGQVSILGDTVREIEVSVDLQKLLGYHLTLTSVEDAIRNANTIEAVGRLNKDYKQFLIVTSSEVGAVESIGNIPVSGSGGSIVYVRDVARVFDGSEDKLMLISGNGEPAAQVNVTRQIGGNILSIEEGVVEKVKELGKTLPQDVHMTKVYDLAEFIRASIASVRDAIALGCVLSVIILLFFLRDLRSTVIAACSIPLTLMITVFFMMLMNQTLNLMSLGGMAVAIGLVIDDAIVVVENIHRHLQAIAQTGETKTAAVRAATNEILGAVAGSTFTTVVVFLPLSLVEGVVGQFFAAFSITLSAAVLISLVIAFTLIPVMAERYLHATESNAEKAGDRMLNRVTDKYGEVVGWALHHTWIVLGTTAILVGVGVVIYLGLGSGFLPIMDEGSFVLDYWTPAGTSLQESDRVLHQVEKILKDTPEVYSFSRRTGAELGLFATPQNVGDILVRLKTNRKRGVEEVMDDVRQQVESSLPEIRVEFVQILQDILGDLEGESNPIEVKIFGDDLDVLQERAKSISEQMEKIPGIVDLFNGTEPGNPEILVQMDPNRVQLAGLDPESVAKQMNSALLGDVVTQIRQFDRLIGVRVRFSDEQRFNYDMIRQFPLVDEKGNITPLSAVATFREVNGQGELLRENQRQMIAVTAGISGTSLGDAIAQVKQILDKTPLPLGYTYEIGGQYQSQQHSFRQLLLVLFIAVMLVFILLVLQFRDLLAATVILSAAPVSLIGALLMLWITGTEFNVSSFMGLIMLIGLIVKNGIILIEYTFQIRQEEGVTMEQALIRAGKTRLRPILMTTLATLFGLLPLALGWGAGSELQRPLALAVIGGLSLSMLVTLVLVPVLLLKLER